MANIQAELAAIMSAVYGQQVRSSIHNAIEKINDVSEVVLSTGVQIDSPTSSSEGFYEDSLYLNTNTFELWKCTGVNSWVSLGTLKGQKGDPGTDGNKWYRGTQVSATSLTAPIDANIGDNYINTTEGKIYHCTVSGNPSTWVYDMTLTGGGSGGASSLNELDDVTIAEATNGQGLVYESGVWKNKNIASDVDIDNTTIVKNGSNQLAVSSNITEKLSRLDIEENVSTALDKKADKATTLSGYGITNAYTNTEVDNKLDNWYEQTPQATATGEQTVTFTGLDASKAYELWFETSNGSQVGIKSSSLSGTTLSYVVSIPSDCPVPVNFKLRVIK